ncbi:aldose 1-epimerase [Magnaporthiopsis poae ATCC 64411]|uniref:Aldose 1-epimerase n=1 Tax=Magnaporthiopsis poae (strain ATCC 64411 / 73-15) TaxID=644358 RepID=A0A0C4DYL4_MAGP6|nr:aldose 1-epimerase [Magnaporthiopsis poae ATCC 64411]
MRSSAAILALLGGGAIVSGQAIPPPGADGRYTIKAKGIKAQFIPYGASLTNLFVKDKNGKDVDVVLGYDNASYYPVDPGHPVLNSIPGRYVGRIGGANYTIDGKKYQTEKNDGQNTLHSGTNNWSFRFWNVTAVASDCITFSILDKSNSSLGMLGDVQASVTYSVGDGGVWNISMAATSPQARTPLMLTQHTYFNLDAYRGPAKIWNHTLHLPYSGRYLEMDDGALPTGKTVSHNPRSPKGAVVATLASSFSGVKAELRTDQLGLQIYTCNWFDGTSPLKSTQGTAQVKTVGRSSCVAIEAQDYADGINHPEWKRTEAQITGPGEKYTWDSSWTFSRLGY